MYRLTIVRSAVLIAIGCIAVLASDDALAQRSEERDLPAPGGSGLPEEFVPLIEPSLQVRHMSSPIVIDGDLDEAAWRAANWVTNFSEMWPGDRSEPPIEMKAGLTFDDEYLYVAFKVFDDPGRVRSTLTDRDKMWRDDLVSVLLDTYGDGGWAYRLASNPIGVQGDTRVVTGAEEEDESFDIVFDSEGHLTDFGYQVEMAIPFRSLRFPSEKQSWKVNLEVAHPRDSRRLYVWSAVDRNDACAICQFGTVSGLENVSPGAGIEVLPALVGSQSAALRDEDDPASGLDNHSPSIEPSLGVKYTFNSNLVGDFTLNPDFSQVEADAAQIDVNESFALFFPEKRPFFQEGSDLYATPIQTVYTRSINNPSVAAKMTGRFDRTNVGYIGAGDVASPIIIPMEESSEFVSAGRSFSNIARLRRSFSGGSNVGVQVTDRRFVNGGSGSTMGFDGTFRFNRNLQLTWQFVGSHTEEIDDPSITEEIDGVDTLRFDSGRHTVAFDGERFSGYATRIGFGRNSRNWTFRADYGGFSPTFRADNGFVTQNNLHIFSTWHNYSFWPSDGFFRQVRPQTYFEYDIDFQGRRRGVYHWVGLLLQMKGQTRLIVSRMVLGNEMYAGRDFRGMHRTWMRIDSDVAEWIGIEAEGWLGEQIAKGEDIPVMGVGAQAEALVSLKPARSLVLQPTLAYSRLRNKETREMIFDGYILRLRSDYQATKRVSVRLIAQYDRFDERLEIDPLVTYRVNPFTAFYLGSTHDYRDYEAFGGGLRSTNRQFFFKVQYLLRS